jgi:prepilin-type N-terminal cleavage/methylation domain-containing protein
MQKQKGFTIIELIVVIAIIAVLAAIVVTSVNVYLKKSRHAAELADVKQLTTAATIYFNNHGNYDNLCGDTAGGDSQFPKILDAIRGLTGSIGEVSCLDTNPGNFPELTVCADNTWLFASSNTFSDSTWICADSFGVHESSADNEGPYVDGTGKCCCNTSGSAEFVCP